MHNVTVNSTSHTMQLEKKLHGCSMGILYYYLDKINL